MTDTDTRPIRQYHARHRWRVDLERVGLWDICMYVAVVSRCATEFCLQIAAEGRGRGCLCAGRAGCSAREGLERPGIGGLA